MGLVIAALLIVGVIAVAGGGHTVDGIERDTRTTSDKITNEMNE